ncbi:MAG: RDD family protein [Pseudomonadota bacterium]
MTVTDPFPGLPSPDTRPEIYDGVPLKRGFAWLIDAVLTGLLTALALPLTAFLGLFFFPFLYMLVGFLYRWVTLSNGSATPGMRLAAIELRNRYGETFDAGTAFMHTLGYTLSVSIFPLQLVSIALMLISERGQGLSDHVLGTTAVNKMI